MRFSRAQGTPRARGNGWTAPSGFLTRRLGRRFSFPGRQME